MQGNVTGATPRINLSQWPETQSVAKGSYKHLYLVRFDARDFVAFGRIASRNGAKPLFGENEAPVAS